MKARLIITYYRTTIALARDARSEDSRWEIWQRTTARGSGRSRLTFRARRSYMALTGSNDR